ncbi:MAG: histidine triad nucleotide-binding protein [Anaerolineales bacterium]|nr:histidine triad nucleotide-binding protein [Anaerolineales bacterium]
MTAKTLFTKIIDGEIPGDFVYRDDRIVAIRDIAPKAPTHILIIPVKPLVGVDVATAEDQALLGDLLLVGARLARELGLEAGGYRLVINTGADGGQSVPHLHVHLLGGRPLAWPPG